MRGLWFAAVIAGCSFDPQPGAGDGTDTTPPADAAITCPASYDQKFGQHSYRVLGDLVTWPDAAAECARDGAHLIKIDDATENAEVERQMEASFGFSFDLWIGLDDPANTGTYQWFDGSQPATFVNWDEVPTAQNSDCVSIRSRDGGGRWFTHNCTNNTFVAVCECHGP